MTTKNHQRISILAITAAIIAIAAVIVVLVWKPGKPTTSVVNSFQACKNAGGALLESYPEQCVIDGKSFTNDAQQPKSSNGDEYVGLAEQAALDKAKSENKPARIVERDGESLPVTMDYVPGRLNLYVKDGNVYKIQVEGSETQ